MANEDAKPNDPNSKPVEGELSDLEMEQVAGGLIRKEVMQTPGGPGDSICTPQGPIDHGGLLDPFATDGLISKLRTT